jgi:hypothetical protein
MVMGLGTQLERRSTGDEASSCPLASPLTGRVPGILAFLAAFAAAFAQPLFFAVAGALLATISLLISPAGCRCLGLLGLLAAIGGGLLGAGHIL